MTRRPVSNVGASVRQRLTTRARERAENVQLVLTRFAIERLLFRLAQSPHRDDFVLKGACFSRSGRLFLIAAPAP